jgi:signal transduction histidine kinase
LLDLGRLEEEKMSIEIKPINIPEILNEAKEQLSLLAQVNNIEIRINCNEKFIESDENLLLRIIMNLLNNAIKVSDEDTLIDINVEEHHNDIVKFSVTDQGPGIQKGTENKLFGKYYRGKSLYMGSGIGLAFCKYAVELLGGNIRIESEEGKGTMVIFILPKKREMGI